MRRSRPGPWPASGASAPRSSSARRSRRVGGHLLALFIAERVRPLRSLRTTIAEIHEQGGLAIPAHPLVPYPLCAQGWVLRRLLDDPDPRVRPDAIEAFNPTTLGRPWHGRVVRFAGEHGLADRRQQRRPRRRRDRRRLDDVPGPDGRRPPGGDPRSHDPSPRLVPRHDVAARDVRAPAPQVRPRRSRHGGRQDPARRDGPRPRLSRAAATGRRASTRPSRRSGSARAPIRDEDRPRLAVRLPAAGRRHPARPATSTRTSACAATTSGSSPRRTASSARPRATSSGSARASRCRSTARSGRSRCRRATSPRSGTMLEREQFDLLHFHEPFVPFLSPIILRLSTSVNIATFHAYGGFSPSYEFGSRVMGGYAARLHGRIAVSGAAKHFIDRYFPGEYKVIPNGVDVERFQRAVPLARWQDGKRNLLFVGRHEPRKGLLELLKAYRILRKAGCDCRLLVVGQGPLEPRGPALRRDPPARRRRVPRPGQRRREGPAVPDGRRLRLAGDRRRVVRDRPARGDGGRDADRRVRHPRLQGRRPARPRGAARPAARAEADRRGRRPPPARRRRCTSEMGAERRRPAPRSSAGSGSPPRSTTSTAS